MRLNILQVWGLHRMGSWSSFRELDRLKFGGSSQKTVLVPKQVFCRKGSRLFCRSLEPDLFYVLAIKGWLVKHLVKYLLPPSLV